MIIAKELNAPFATHHHDRHCPLYCRIDVDTDSDLAEFLALNRPDAIPVLVKNRVEVHETRWDQTFFSHIIEQYVKFAKKLLIAGFSRQVIAVDNDSAMQKILSPRFGFRDLNQRKAVLIDLFAELKPIVPHVVVLLTVEELAPGGFDATDGQAVAKELESLGLKEIIATAGTKDFMPLYARHATKQKPTAQHEFLSNEPSLASALWLLESTGLSVWASAYIDDETHAIELAQSLGLAGLIEKAPIKDIKIMH